MKILYWVGIDYGDGETTATVWNIQKKQTEKVRFNNTSNKDEFKIPSVIYRRKKEDGHYDYRLKKSEGYLPCISFKGKPNELIDDQREIFKNFIQISVFSNIISNILI